MRQLHSDPLGFLTRRCPLFGYPFGWYIKTIVNVEIQLPYSTGEFTGFLNHQQYQSLFFHCAFCFFSHNFGEAKINPETFPRLFLPRDQKNSGAGPCPSTKTSNTKLRQNVFLQTEPGFLPKHSPRANEKFIMPIFGE